MTTQAVAVKYNNTNPVCVSPSEFVDKSVNVLEPTKMVCPPPPFAAHIFYSAKLIMYVTFGIVLIVVAIAAYRMYNGGAVCRRTPKMFSRFGVTGARANAGSTTSADPSFDYRSLRMNADDEDPKQATKKGNDNDSDSEQPSFV